jgi:hypothetical protein
MTCNSDELLTLRTINIPAAIEEATGRALGLGSLAPRLADQMFDAMTGERVAYVDVFRRMGRDPAPLMRILETYPKEVADDVFNGHITWPTQLYHVMPSEYLPIVDYVQRVVLRAHLPADRTRAGSSIALPELIQATNDTISAVFLQNYSHIYKL